MKDLKKESMKTKNRLSHSRMRMFQECPKKYDYHYNHGLKEKYKSSALCFGTAIDKAIEACLKNKDIDEEGIFWANWGNQEINGKLIDLARNTIINFSPSDFDADILSPAAIALIVARMEELGFGGLEGDYKAAFDHCAKLKKQSQFRKWTEEENLFFNYCCWVSLGAKASYMLKANREEILPKIKKIHAIQKKIDLDNGHDEVIGFADLVCDFEDWENIVLDYKTSSADYSFDSVRTSPQLSLYAHALGIRHGGFIVLKKSMNKSKVKKCERCGFDGSAGRHKTCSNMVNGSRCNGAWVEALSIKADTQIIIDEIPTRTEDIVIDNVEEINRAINADIYVRNFNACEGSYGKCAYYDLCYKNDSSKLEKTEG